MLSTCCLFFHGFPSFGTRTRVNRKSSICNLLRYSEPIAFGIVCFHNIDNCFSYYESSIIILQLHFIRTECRTHFFRFLFFVFENLSHLDQIVYYKLTKTLLSKTFPFHFVCVQFRLCAALIETGWFDDNRFNIYIACIHTHRFKLIIEINTNISSEIKRKLIN